MKQVLPMATWYRVFGRSEAPPAPADIEACLAGAGHAVTSSFAGDAAGWYRADLSVGGAPVAVERWLADEDGVRAELNSWAAVLETCEDSPPSRSLMERRIQWRQLRTSAPPKAEGVRR